MTGFPVTRFLSDFFISHNRRRIFRRLLRFLTDHDRCHTITKILFVIIAHTKSELSSTTDNSGRISENADPNSVTVKNKP